MENSFDAEQVNRAVSVNALFRHRTIEAQSQLIMDNVADLPNITPIDATNARTIPVSPAQERLLFIHEFENGSSAYNIDAAFELPGSVDVSALEQALRVILSRHEALRTLLVKDQATGTYLQRILSPDEAQAMFTVAGGTAESMEELDQGITSLSRHVSRLDKELPWQARILRHKSDQQYYLVLVFHHTSFDAWSLNVFERELQVLYANLRTNVEGGTSLPPLKVQYKEYAQHHRQQLSATDRVRHISDFWLQNLSGLEPLQLITDRPRPAQFDYAGVG
ncbi:condensation domain-containing protein [Chaetomidium leptoderma]|uniref:Condensation domain-containing protein n=1 Tax=Chaetomidium leptoderma TaxID=669021 RepID=A0AAN6VC91_9PEZI|nr:condensation domain-containing protein [Chaetomidium leptoderma]